MDKKIFWHVIYTRPKQEKKLASQLSDLNIKCFLPLIKDVRQWHDRKKVVELPLFPSYVFVNITNTEELYKSSELNGFVSYVKFGSQMAKVDSVIIENIRTTITNFSSIEVVTSYFGPGQTLLISDGPLCGLKCELIQYKGKRKAIVRVDHLNKSLLVDIPINLMIQTQIDRI
ncbi:UpxY family transcription antiterminator [Pedobacter psychrotolerans]|nr:UpxY family transcription antiterminator [Pedobacter psychrotolerans]